MKKIMKKILIIILIILLLNNFFIQPSQAYAVETVDDIISFLTGCVGVLVSILTWPIRLVAILAGYAINTLTAGVAYVDGATAGNSAKLFITPFDIFFNKVKIFDVNFFDLTNDGSITYQIRATVAGWFYIMRTLSAVILLVILIYVGIRMAISTIATDRAMYKKMLVDWTASLVLIFVLQYIMIFIIYINNAMVNAISIVVDSEEIENTFNNIAGMAVDFKSLISLDSLAATAIFCMLVWQTLGLVFSYINRMIKVAFLVIISPLISLTYSIDKMGDGKAQALEAWLKEFTFTILIQPFHCAIYMCFIDAAFDILVKKSGLGGLTDGGGALAASIVVLLCVRFVKEGEKIVRKIFAFKDDNSTTSLAAGVAMSAVALSQAKNIGRTARTAVNGTVKFAKNVVPGIKTAGIEIAAAAGAISNINSSEKTTFAERKEAIIVNSENKKAQKIENSEKEKDEKNAKKLQKKYQKKGKEISLDAARLKVKGERATQNHKDKLNKEIQLQKQKNPTISDSEAESKARLSLIRKERKDRRKDNKVIKGVSTTFYKVKNKLDTETGRVIADIAKQEAMLGVGFMVGSGVYGTNGDIATAIASGAATSASLGEFLKESKGTLTNGIKENVKSISEVTDGESARKVIDEVSRNEEKYNVADGQKGKDELKKLLEEIVEAAGLDGDEKYKQTIDTTIQNVQNSPFYAGSILTDFANTTKNATLNNNNIDKEALDKKSDALKDFGYKVAISQDLQRSESMGVSIADISEKVSIQIDSERVDESPNKKVFQKANEIVSAVSYAESIDDSFKEQKEMLDGMESKDIKEVSKRFEEEIKTFEKLIKDKSSQIEKESSQEHEETSKEKEDKKILEKLKESQKIVEVQATLLISQALTDENRILDDAGKELAREYQEKLDRAIEILKNEDENKYKNKINEMNALKRNLFVKCNPNI